MDACSDAWYFLPLSVCRRVGSFRVNVSGQFACAPVLQKTAGVAEREERKCQRNTAIQHRRKGRKNREFQILDQTQGWDNSTHANLYSQLPRFTIYHCQGLVGK